MNDWTRHTNDQILFALRAGGYDTSLSLAEEFVRRGPAVVDLLCATLRDPATWALPDPENMLPVHAMLLLGAIADPRAIPTLLDLARTRDLETYTTDDLPVALAMFGPPVMGELFALARDADACAIGRYAATRAAYLIACGHPAQRARVEGLLLDLLRTPDVDPTFAFDVGLVLLDVGGAEAVAAVREAIQHGPLDEDFDVEMAGIGEAMDSQWAWGQSARHPMEHFGPGGTLEYLRESQQAQPSRAMPPLAPIVQPSRTPSVKAAPKVGRNDPCPCGSGKKFKKCCERAAAATPPGVAAPLADALADPRALASTVTGESFQPARVYYDVLDPAALSVALHRLRCVKADPAEGRSVWLWADEARSITFRVPYDRLPATVHPIVLANLRMRGASTWIVDVRSFDRVTAALRFFARHVPAHVARPTHVRVVNRLFQGSEILTAPKSLDGYLDRDAVTRTSPEALMASVSAASANARGFLERARAVLEAVEAAGRAPIPELEEIVVNEDDPGNDFEGAALALNLRGLLAMEHWLGNTHVTMYDMLERVAARM